MSDYKLMAGYAIAHFVNSLSSETNWICLNNQLSNYNVSAFSQETDVVKYRLDKDNSEISAVFLTEKRDVPENDVVLEVVFSSKPDCVFQLPLSDRDKAVLKETIDLIRKYQEENLYKAINENLPRWQHSL